MCVCVAGQQELRIAEMEAMKAANIMENYKEIASRPARTWFQTAAQKAAVKRAALAALQVRVVPLRVWAMSLAHTH